MSNHVHVEKAVFMELLDNRFWRDTNGGDEQLGARLNNDIDKLIALPFGIVVTDGCELIALIRQPQINEPTLSSSHYHQSAATVSRHRKGYPCHRGSL